MISISAQEAIARFRRDAAIGLALKIVLFVGVGAVMFLHFVPQVMNPTLLMMGLGVVWIVLWQRTMKSSRLAAESSTLIATGDLERAEEIIAGSLRSFSMSLAVTSMNLLNLALLRLAQKRWPDAALLCREVLARPRGTPEHLTRSGRLLLADSLLEMGDLRGVHEAISGLYRYRLTLGEALNLLRVQTEYLARIGAWGQIMDGIPTKVQLAELMPAGQGARNGALTQAYLALAAKKTGQPDWANWLRRRVELLVDIRELAAQRPMLWELWQM